VGLGGIDLNLLVTLRALLEEGNVTHAGGRVGMSQPAVSVALGRLRRHYRDEILIRNGRDYELTPLAKALLPSVQESLRLVEQALDAGHGFDPGTSDRTLSMAATDYATMMLSEGLLGALRAAAPGVRLDIDPLPPDMHSCDKGLLKHDLVIGPLGAGFPGHSEVLFRDRFVCVVDRDNPRLRDGWLSLDDLARMPFAAARFGHSHVPPAERILDELGVSRRTQVTTVGWLSLPFLVAGTDLVAVVPELLARRVAAAAGIVVVEPPFGRVDLIEAAWWHPSRATDPATQWLLGLLRAAAAPTAEPVPDPPSWQPLESVISTLAPAYVASTQER
jgi:DNA-binding transcriptional LysR family regulator